MATRVIDDTKLNDIAVAIQAKDSGGQMTIDEMPTRIANIPSGGGIKEKTVNFYNYTGELLYSYTANEITELTELPEAPTVQGMTFQTWNWSLANIKSWVQNHDEGSLPVGAVFVIDDGHTRIYMHLREPKMASKEMPFCIQQMAGTVVIGWGDDSQPETITAAGIYSHLWQVNSYPADVMIDIEYVPSGTTKLVLGWAVGNTTYGLFNNETYYASCVEKVEYGTNTDMLIYSATFKNCSKLKSINLPMSFTSIGNYTFNGCKNLALTVLPDGITSIGNNAFSGCTNLALTVLPDSITSIGDGAFQGCTNLALTVLPDGITSISNYAFVDCTNLALTVLPDGITSIGNNAFNGCRNLALTVLPDGVTSIGGGAFQNCTSLYFIDLTAFTDPQAIPTLVSANAFQNISATAQFIVKNQEMYDAFTTATNWSTYASKFVIEGA